MRRIALVVALLFAPAAGAAYKCVDERGLTHVGDTPPAGCANVVMFEITPNGHVLRRIEPTPTPEQLKVLEEQQRRKREADKAASEQKRKDQALLSTFASEKEFDTARERNIEPLASRIRSARERIKAVDQRLAKIDEEMEFYTAGKSRAAAGKQREVPHVLVAEKERLRTEKRTLGANIASYESDIQAQRARFEADRKRWVQLKAAGGVNDAPKATAVPIAGK